MKIKGIFANSGQSEISRKNKKVAATVATVGSDFRKNPNPTQHYNKNQKSRKVPLLTSRFSFRKNSRKSRSFMISRKISKRTILTKIALVPAIVLVAGALVFAKVSPSAHAASAADPSTIAGCAGAPTDASGNVQCFAFTVNTTLTTTGATTGTSSTFAIPTSTHTFSSGSQTSYNWNINWGDGSTVQNATGTVTSSGSAAGITHTYATPGTYQITIQPNTTTPVSGWMNAFGSYNASGSGALAPANLAMVSSVDTPITNLSRTSNVGYRFAGMFNYMTNMAIPDNLFSQIDTSASTDVDNMFAFTFANMNNQTAALPSTLFSTINTSAATNTSNMFYSTFAGWTSENQPVPANLFSTINTGNSTNTNQMFYSTFSNWIAENQPLPANLFSAINTSKATNTSGMFYLCFYNWKAENQAIPGSLFAAVNTSASTNTSSMFQNTFNNWTSENQAIPANLFASIATNNSKNMTNMFNGTFQNWSVENQAIPAPLFNAINTSSATTTYGLFNSTFAGWTSENVALPDNLFNSISTNASLNTDASYMFESTFDSWSSETQAIPSHLFGSTNNISSLNMNSTFNGTFYGWTVYNSTLPSQLFASIDTSSATNTSSMFNYTFEKWYAFNQPIPSGLFASINTSNATATAGMFLGTFQWWTAVNQPIPADLFSSVNTSKATTVSSMFYNTFYDWAAENQPLPEALFASIDTTQATDVSDMFVSTFNTWTAETSPVPQKIFAKLNTQNATNTSTMFQTTFSGWPNSPSIIPANFFANISTTSVTSATNLSNMYQNTFSGSFYRLANFIVNGNMVQTQKFGAAYGSLYQMNDQVSGATNISAPTTAGNTVAVAYNTYVRNVVAPTGNDGSGIAYSSYNWFTTDGTSCAVANPTSTCGAQTATTKFSFPTQQWTTTTDPSTGNLNLYAQISHTVSFNTNGGTPTPSSQTVVSGNTATEPAAPSRNNYTFAGWYLDNNKFADSFDFSTPIYSDTTLYAKWNPDTYVISFSANGGEGQMADLSSSYPETTATLSQNEFSRNGYTFTGWNTSADGSGTAYDDMVSVDLLSLNGQTLYAQWQINSYDVTFSDGFGNQAAPGQSVKYQENAVQPDNPNRPNSHFEYWYLCSDSSQSEFDFATPIVQTTELCAKWSGVTTDNKPNEPSEPAEIAPINPPNTGFLGSSHDSSSNTFAVYASAFTIILTAFSAYFAKKSHKN